MQHGRNPTAATIKKNNNEISTIQGKKRTQAYSSLVKQVVQSQFFDSLTILMGPPPRPLLVEDFKAMLRGPSDAWI